ncbi:MAG: UDP-N-acetylglucosamine 1-carboxyvinyltransferase, partial [Candidatus Muiribacteriaceae bacterium]
MDFYSIRGGRRLKGNVSISGSKNSALPLLAAAILVRGKVCLRNIPALKDVFTMFDLLKHIGAEVDYKQDDKTVFIDTSDIRKFEAPYDLVKKMRASFIIAGPLISVMKKAYISLPGGCAIGARPVDIHIKAFERLGIVSENAEGYIRFRKDGRKTRTLPDEIDILLDFPSVGATQNIIMAAVSYDNRVCIRNAAQEPEITCLIDFLNAAGCNITFETNGNIVVHGGRENIRKVDFTNIPDRIETGTFIAAALITGGDVRITDTCSEHVRSIIDKCVELGADIKYSNRSIHVRGGKNLRSSRLCTTPYPGFPTDMQAQFCALLSTVEGTSIVEETIFENRFMHIPELNRLGADIDTENNIALIRGGCELTG